LQKRLIFNITFVYINYIVALTVCWVDDSTSTNRAGRDQLQQSVSCYRVALSPSHVHQRTFLEQISGGSRRVC